MIMKTIAVAIFIFSLGNFFAIFAPMKTLMAIIVARPRIAPMIVAMKPNFVARRPEAI